MPRETDSDLAPGRSPIFRRILSGLSLLVCVGAIATVYRGLQETDWPLVWANLNQISLRQLGFALIFVACSYGAIACYDVLAFRYLQKKLALRKILFAGLITYSISPNVGFAFLSGSVLRYRLYRQWWVSNVDIAKIIAFTNLSLWVGLIPMTGLVFVATNFELPETIATSFMLLTPTQFGVILLVMSALYLGVVGRIQKPIRWRKFSLEFPTWQLTIQQVGVFAFDWGFAALTLSFLLGHPLLFPTFFRVYVIAMVAGLMSTIPGGLGVFETVMVFFLEPNQTREDILAVLIVFRCLYYFLPFTLAVFALISFEVMQRLRKI
ncbi:hypothetical protein Lepto7376_3201 [[Leptolyngbya] sp. PCC 7376]|uniref:lysylphosphatidylglycerol synthase domain-containing protein n=1 Tax=[Leptolyngbya] sp. PCC 7376 TaxID=111781 RepID=UPI00029ECADA|nr:lysylphosphatidylglycerol synthase domain-containing protein [[Leptolyngbya] sp. PCC 7376]AFY39430.1 hypothetical protein Lepto7376_3201 [[Leptolyngbya] sp. PCC 7376]